MPTKAFEDYGATDIRVVRSVLRLDGERVAEASGLSKSHLSKIERGERRVEPERAKEIMRGVLRVGLEELEAAA